MASVEDCVAAFGRLSDRLAAVDPKRRKRGFDRTLTCTVTDLDVVFAGRLSDGLLSDVHPATSDDAKVRLSMASDDLIALVDGSLSMAPAWASGRIKVRASALDLVRLKSIF